jgi:small subunit ribosomal protein S8
MVTDPIADMLTIIRNGYLARLKSVTIPASKLKVALAVLLEKEGYISSHKVDVRILKVTLKYVSVANSLTKVPAVKGISRISKPGLRIYKDSNHIPRVMGGIGTIIVSTNKGLLSGKESRKQALGGEVICSIW